MRLRCQLCVWGPLLLAACGTEVRLDASDGGVDARVGDDTVQMPFASLPRDSGISGWPKAVGCGPEACALVVSDGTSNGLLRFSRPEGAQLDAEPYGLPFVSSSVDGDADAFCGAGELGAWRLRVDAPPDELQARPVADGRRILGVTADDGVCHTVESTADEGVGHRVYVMRWDGGEERVVWRSEERSGPSPDTGGLFWEPDRLVIWSYGSLETNDHVVVRARLDDPGSTGQVVGTLPGAVRSYVRLDRILLGWDAGEEHRAWGTPSGISGIDAAGGLEPIWQPEEDGSLRMASFGNGAFVTRYLGGWRETELVRVDARGMPDAAPIVLLGSLRIVGMPLSRSRVALLARGGSMGHYVVEYR